MPSFLLAIALALGQPQAQAQTQATPPRPVAAPAHAIERHSPMVHQARFSAVVTTSRLSDGFFPSGQRRYETSFFNIDGAEVALPLLVEGPYSKVDPQSLTAKLWLDDGRSDWSPTVTNRDAGELRLAVAPTTPPTLRPGDSTGMSVAALGLSANTSMTSIQWEFGWNVETWSCRVNESVAATATWPVEWPAEAREWLGPQRFIESDDPRFAAFVASSSGGALRRVPIYYAAKDLIRATMLAITDSGSADSRGDRGVLFGMTLRGAAEAMAAGRGSRHDITAACVAVLRAAGIPARPVIGFDPRERNDRGDRTFETWGEFFLPGSGWVPFVPSRRNGPPLRTLDVRAPWPSVGTIDDLNRLVPVAHAFVPSLEGYGWFAAPAVWGLRPGPRGLGASLGDFTQRILLNASVE